MSHIHTNPPPILIYDAPRRLIICTICQVGVFPMQASVHLQTLHALAYTLETCCALTMSLPLVEAICPRDCGEVFAAESHGFHPALRLYSNAYQCRVHECNFACLSLSTLRRKHLPTHPPTSVSALPTPYKYPVYVMTLFPAPYLHFFCVSPPPSAVTPALDNNLVQRMKAQMNSFCDAKSTWLCNLAIAPSETPSSSISLWDKRTQWYLHFAGRDMDLVSEAASLSLPSDPSIYRTVLLPAIMQFILDCHSAGISQGVHLRRQLRSSTTQVLSPKPFCFVDIGTLNKYAIV